MSQNVVFTLEMLTSVKILVIYMKLFCFSKKKILDLLFQCPKFQVEFANLRASHVFVPYMPLCLRCLTQVLYLRILCVFFTNFLRLICAR